MFKIMGEPIVLAFIFSAFFYVLIEQSIQNFLPTFNNKVLLLPAVLSIQMGSILAGSTALGRFLAGLILKKLNWFEKQSWSDDGKFGCFLRQPGDFPLPIYFYDSGAYFSMPLSLEAYFDAMIDSCAVRGWQYFYIDIPEQFPEFREVNKHKVLAEMELTLNLLPNLFQNKDFSYHMNRFEGFKNIIIQKP